MSHIIAVNVFFLWSLNIKLLLKTRFLYYIAKYDKLVRKKSTLQLVESVQ